MHGPRNTFTLSKPAARAIALALLVASAGLAQEDKPKEEKKVGQWHPSAEAGVNLNQSAYSDNWAGGDKGSVVWTFIFNGALENQLSEKVNWNNSLKLAYGQTHQQVVNDKGERVWARPEKSTDLVDYETVFRLTAGWIVDPFVSGRFESLFQDASDSLGRNLAFNPLKFKESAGFARHIIDEENRSLLSRIGLTLRQSSRRYFVDETDANSLATASASTHDAGLEWVTDYSNKILNDRVTWTSKLTLYKAFMYSGDDVFDALTAQQLADAGVSPDVTDYTTAVDIDWENIFTTQITKIISVNLYTRWIYDKYDNTVLPVLAEDGGALANADKVGQAIRKAGQFKYTMAIGIVFRLI
jgi:hypothetical protein